MSGDEIIGDIAQGALTARAIEPEHGESELDDGHTHERACLNCGTPLVGSHCHQCGQAAHVHRTLGAFFHDLLHGVFHFEGKIWRTVPLLAWNPGKLTREYIDGRRASYVSPIALFLFVVFFTFALFNLVGNPLHFNTSPQDAAQARADILAEERQLEAKIIKAKAAGHEFGALEGELAGARASREALDYVSRGELPETIARSDTPEDRAITDDVNAAWAKAKSNPELMVYKLQQSAYKYSWLLIPLSVPFVWLLFPFRRRFHLYDHTVFVTYSLSFMLMLLALVSLLAVWGSAAWLIPLALLYAPFHMYRQLRGTYATSRFGACWRTLLLSLFALIALLLFATVVALMVAGG